MGVSGVGKSTVGRLLADRLGAAFLDADDFHLPDSVAKMRAGTPLEEADRAPWLARLHDVLAEHAGDHRSAVLACSALKAAHRAVLSQGLEVRFVHLTGAREVIAARLAGRRGHYMPPALLDSQFATLEPPDDAIAVDVALPPEAIVTEVLPQL